MIRIEKYIGNINSYLFFEKIKNDGFTGMGACKVTLRRNKEINIDRNKSTLYSYFTEPLHITDVDGKTVAGVTHHSLSDQLEAINNFKYYTKIVVYNPKYNKSFVAFFEDFQGAT